MADGPSVAGTSATSYVVHRAGTFADDPIVRWVHQPGRVRGRGGGERRRRRVAPFELIETSHHVGHQPFGQRVAERCLGIALAHRRRTALGRQQVDRQRAVAVSSEPWGDRSDVWRQTTILVDHEDGALGCVDGGVHTDEVDLPSRQT